MIAVSPALPSRTSDAQASRGTPADAGDPFASVLARVSSPGRDKDGSSSDLTTGEDPGKTSNPLPVAAGSLSFATPPRTGEAVTTASLDDLARAAAASTKTEETVTPSSETLAGDKADASSSDAAREGNDLAQKTDAAQSSAAAAASMPALVVPQAIAAAAPLAAAAPVAGSAPATQEQSAALPPATLKASAVAPTKSFAVTKAAASDPLDLPAVAATGDETDDAGLKLSEDDQEAVDHTKTINTPTGAAVMPDPAVVMQTADRTSASPSEAVPPAKATGPALPATPLAAAKTVSVVPGSKSLAPNVTPPAAALQADSTSTDDLEESSTVAAISSKSATPVEASTDGAPPRPVAQVLAALEKLGLGTMANPATPLATQGGTPAAEAVRTPAHAATTQGTAADAAPPQGSRSMTVKLNPDHLGPVAITMRMRGDSVDVRISVGTPEALHLLEQDRSLLTSALTAAGGSRHDLQMAQASTTVDIGQTRGQASTSQGDLTRGQAFTASDFTGERQARSDAKAQSPNSFATSGDDETSPSDSSRRVRGDGSLYV